MRHTGSRDGRYFFHFAALAFNRSALLALSTTKRAWVPVLMVSSSSLAWISNTTLRPSTLATLTVISTVMPGKVAARCFTDTSVPTESSPGSACCRISRRQVSSMSRIMYGVPYTRQSSPMKPMVRGRSTVMLRVKVTPGCRLDFIVSSTSARSLFRAVGAVSGVAEPGYDVGVLVEMVVDRRGPELHVGMDADQPLDAFGRGEQAGGADGLGAALLQSVDCRHHGVGGRDHGRDHDHVARCEIGGGLQIILDRHLGVGVAIE